MEHTANQAADTIFPAGAGMNRRDEQLAQCGVNVPRRRGDEPWYVAYMRSKAKCSRRRGDEPAKIKLFAFASVCSPQARG